MRWMSQFGRPLALTSLVATLALSSPTMVMAQTSKEIEAQYNELVASASGKYEAGDIDGAIEDFKKAYALRKEPNILYNIGRLYEEQGKFEEAKTQYEQFVGLPGIELESRKDALERIKTLREILEMRKKEEEEKRRKEEEERKKNEPPVVVKPKAEADYTMAYIFLGTGVGALAGAGVVGFLADGAHTDFEEATTLDDRRAAASSGKTLSGVADGLLIGGAVLTTLGVIFWATASPQEEKPQTSGATLLPSIGPGGASVTYSVSF